MAEILNIDTSRTRKFPDSGANGYIELFAMLSPRDKDLVNRWHECLMHNCYINGKRDGEIKERKRLQKMLAKFKPSK